MKISSLIGILFFSLLIALPAEGEAQVRRASRTTVVKVNRPAKRKVRRTNRRVQRRTLRRLPAGTRAVAYRSVSYYPVRGQYFIARKGVYMRTFPPRGFRIRTLAVTPLRIVVRGRPYWYAQGVFYLKNNEGYEVTETPVGAVVPELPEERAHQALHLRLDGVVQAAVEGAGL